MQQVARLLDEGRAVGSKELREYLEVRGYANAAEWIYRHGAPAIIRKGDRERYLAALRHADGGDCGPLGDQPA